MVPRNFIIILLLTVFAACKKNNDVNTSQSHESKITFNGTTEMLSEGRYSMSVLQTGDFTCFVGGTVFSLAPFGTTPSTNVDVFNEKMNTWSRVGLSVKRERYGAAALNNKVVIAGGYTTAYTFSPVIDIFDLATGQTTTKNLATPKMNVAIAGAGTKILLAGGLAENAPKVSSVVDIYNTQTGQWTADTLSQPRFDMAGGAAGNKIVFAGGINIVNNVAVYSDRADIYDVQTGKWTTASISKARRGMSVVSAGNKIFFYGGTDGTTNLENVDIYDVSTNRWTVMLLTGNTISYLVASTNGSKVAFPYGSSFNYTKLNIYDAASGSVNIVPLPAPIRSSGFAMAGSKIVIPTGVISDTVSTRIWIYDMVKNQFDTSSFNLPTKRGLVTAATAGNKVVLAGGIWDGKNAMNQREVINYKSVSVFEVK
jgi:hypothetical protein